MRLQVRYPSGQPHEVDLQSRVVIVGRDPSCDLVVHDVKCSRRHAVLEVGPDGVSVRDSGSANGVYVNGHRVERAVLRIGDVISLGEVKLTLLPDHAATGPLAEATLMTPPGGVSVGMPGAYAPPPPPPPPRASAPPMPPPMAHMAPMPPAPMAPPPRVGSGPVPAVRPAMPPPPPPPTDAELRPSSTTGSFRISGSTDSGRVHAASAAQAEPVAAGGKRSLTLTVLSVLWMVSIILYAANVAFGLIRGDLAGMVSAAVSGLLMLVGVAMAIGLWSVKSWARMAQIVIAGIGTLTCAFTAPSVVTLIYMLRPAVKARFAGQAVRDPKEGLFTGLLLGSIVLGFVLIGAAIALAFFGLLGTIAARPSREVFP